MLKCWPFSGIYGFLYLPSGYSSFDHSHPDTNQADPHGYIPLILITLWTFCFSAGVWTLPWMLLSEVFPFKYVKSLIRIIDLFQIYLKSIHRSRGMATGLSAALNYLLGFVSTKSYYDLEMFLSMPGVTLFYCIIVRSEKSKSHH